MHTCEAVVSSPNSMNLDGVSRVVRRTGLHFVKPSAHHQYMSNDDVPYHELAQREQRARRYLLLGVLCLAMIVVVAVVFVVVVFVLYRA